MLYRPYTAALLAEGLKGQLVLLLAPAGFGKSEAMASCYAGLIDQGLHPAWVTVAHHATDQSLEEDIALACGMNGASLSDVLQKIADRLTDQYIFLDSLERYESISDGGIIDKLVRDAPDNLHLIFAGRRLPRMPLSRFRMRGMLKELGCRELAFTRSELQLTLGAWIRGDALERIVGILQGWPAMVTLSRLALEKDAGAETVSALSDGSHPILRDFVLDELVSNLARNDKDVIEAIAGFGVLPLELVARLAGQTADADFMRRMEGLAPILIANEAKHGGVSVHPVVEKVLLAALQCRPGQARCARHLAAARLFAAHGMLEQAVLHAAQGGDYDYAIALFESAGGVTLFYRIGYTVLHSVVQAMPAEQVRATPSLRLGRTLVLAKQGKVREARAAFDALATDIAARPELGERLDDFTMFYIDSMIRITQDRPIGTDDIAFVLRELENSPADDVYRRGWLHNYMTIALTSIDDLDGAREHALRALDLYEDAHSSYPQSFILMHLGFINLMANRLEAASLFCRRAENLIQSRQWDDANLNALARIPMSEVLYLQGHFEAAESRLENALAVISEGEGWRDFIIRGLVVLARAQFSAGRIDRVAATLEMGRDIARSRGIDQVERAMDVLEIEFLTRSGELAAARSRIARLYSMEPETGTARHLGETVRERLEIQIVLARFDLRTGQPDVACGRLERILNDCELGRFDRFALRAHILLMEARWALGQTERAILALHQAASLSQEGNQIQQLLDEGQAVAGVCRALVRKVGMRRLSRVTSDYLSRALGARRPAPNVSGSLMTRREMQILSLLTSGHSNKSMARELALSEATVKFHLKNLFTKLGVSRRTLAVAVARSVGLIDEARDPQHQSKSPVRDIAGPDRVAARSNVN